MTENEIAKILVNIFLKVKRTLGPGLLESLYEAAICYELDKLGIKCKRQQGIAVVYDDAKMDIGFSAGSFGQELSIISNSLRPLRFCEK